MRKPPARSRQKPHLSGDTTAFMRDQAAALIQGLNGGDIGVSRPLPWNIRPDARSARGIAMKPVRCCFPQPSWLRTGGAGVPEKSFHRRSHLAYDPSLMVMYGFRNLRATNPKIPGGPVLV